MPAPEIARCVCSLRHSGAGSVAGRVDVELAVPACAWAYAGRSERGVGMDPPSCAWENSNRAAGDCSFLALRKVGSAFPLKPESLCLELARRRFTPPETCQSPSRAGFYKNAGTATYLSISLFPPRKSAVYKHRVPKTNGRLWKALRFQQLARKAISLRLFFLPEHWGVSLRTKISACVHRAGSTWTLGSFNYS